MNLSSGVVVGGVTISCKVAADLIAALDRLEYIVKRNGAVLAPHLIEVRMQLTRAVTRVDASAEVVDPLDVLASNRNAVADTTEVAKMLNISPDGVRWLCRHRRLDATSVAGRWLISLESARDYQLRAAQPQPTTARKGI